MSHRIDTITAVAVMPAPAAPGVPGFFTEVIPVTTLSGDWCNMVQETVALTVEWVAALNKANIAQCADIIKHAAALQSAAADTGAVSSPHTRGLLACTTSRSDAANAACIASLSSRSGAAESASIACNNAPAMAVTSATIACAIAGGNSPTTVGVRSIVAACSGIAATAGTGSAVIACDGLTAGAGVSASGVRSAVIACEDIAVPPTACVASGTDSAVIASRGSVAAGAVASSCVIASTVSTAGAAGTVDSCVIASNASTATGPFGSAVIASDGSDATGTNTAVIASIGSALADGSPAGVFACDGSRAQGAEAVSVASHDGNASGTRAAQIATDTATVSGTNAAALACGTGVSVNGVAVAVVASLSSDTLNIAVLESACVATDSCNINIADAGDAPVDDLVAAADACTIVGDHWRCAIIAAASSTVTKGPGAAANTTNAQCAIIGGSDCQISTPAAGGGMVDAVLLGSKSTELTDGAAGVPARSYCIAGGYQAGALVPTGAGVGITWRIDSVGGQLLSALAAVVGGQDYAECFENEAPGVLALGSFVARRRRRVRLAGPGDRILGVVSADPSLVGGSSEAWHGRWRRDEFGGVIRQLDQNGIISPVPNPDFDSTRPHVDRIHRPEEWTVVGILGQLRARVDATVREDDFVAAGPGGIGTRGNGGDRVECMEIVVPYDQERGYAVALCLVR